MQILVLIDILMKVTVLKTNLSLPLWGVFIFIFFTLILFQSYLFRVVNYLLIVIQN